MRRFSKQEQKAGSAGEITVMSGGVALNDLIKNLWACTSVYCGNPKHDHFVPMELKMGPRSVFYACPEYAKRYTGGCGCPNRISPEDFEKILDIISKKITASEINNEQIDLTNFQFTYKQIACRVLEHYDGKLSLLLLNKKVFL